MTSAGWASASRPALFVRYANIAEALPRLLRRSLDRIGLVHDHQGVVAQLKQSASGAGRIASGAGTRAAVTGLRVCPVP